MHYCGTFGGFGGGSRDLLYKGKMIDASWPRGARVRDALKDGKTIDEEQSSVEYGASHVCRAEVRELLPAWAPEYSRIRAGLDRSQSRCRSGFRKWVAEEPANLNVRPRRIVWIGRIADIGKGCIRCDDWQRRYDPFRMQGGGRLPPIPSAFSHRFVRLHRCLVVDPIQTILRFRNQASPQSPTISLV